MEGHECMLGNEALFREFFIPLPGKLLPPEPGVTRLWMAVDGRDGRLFRRPRCACGRMRPRPLPN